MWCVKVLLVTNKDHVPGILKALALRFRTIAPALGFGWAGCFFCEVLALGRSILNCHWRTARQRRPSMTDVFFLQPKTTTATRGVPPRLWLCLAARQVHQSLLALTTGDNNGICSQAVSLSVAFVCQLTVWIFVAIKFWRRMFNQVGFMVYISWF